MGHCQQKRHESERGTGWEEERDPQECERDMVKFKNKRKIVAGYFS